MFLHLKRYLGKEMLPLTRTIIAVFETVGNIINASFSMDTNWEQRKYQPDLERDSSNE